MTNNSNITVITTGGTIMKEHDRFIGGIKNTNRDVARLNSFLANINVNPPKEIISICSKDSNDIMPIDIESLKYFISASGPVIIVIHGTDTMVESATQIGDVAGKTIVFVGAFIPMAFQESDAEFNLGYAFGCANFIPSGTYIAMHGNVFHHTKVFKDKKKATFIEK